MKWIINTITSWDEAPRARHQVTNELIKKDNEVIFIERNKAGFSFKLDTKKISTNLTIVTPYFFLNYKYRYRIPVINEIFQLLLYKKLKKKFGVPAVINFDFTAYLINRFFNKYIYYCNDEFIGNSKYRFFLIDIYHKFIEKKVIKNAVFCVATTNYLKNKLIKTNKNVYEIPLGGPDPLEITEQNFHKKNGTIRVGLVGFINSRNFSLSLLNKMNDDLSVRLNLVGPVEVEFIKKLNNPDKITLSGTLVNGELYKRINDFDVTIAPYNLKRKNEGTSPNKLFVYLACGKPVVVSDLPNLVSFSFPERSVYIAKKEDDFLTLIHRAYCEDDPTLVHTRKKYASENSWSKRIEDFLDIARLNGIF